MRAVSGLGIGSVACLGVATMLAGAATLEAGPAAARFDRDRIPDRGRQVAQLTVDEAGRYAVQAESRSGVALQVVDRMAGPGPLSGSPGERDGRVDLFLDRGEVRVVALGSELGRSEARLAARPFRELHESGPVRLVELAPIETELGDLEQRSWWLELPKRRWVAFEAAGRHLADLRLWSEEGWLLEGEPEIETLGAIPERPLRACRLVALLEPGRYRLTAYGGPETPWSQDSAARPLYLRWGLPRRGATGREAGVVGPLGYDRFLVSGRADYFRLELPEPREAALELATYEPQRPFTPGSAATIAKESVPPEAVLSRDSAEGWVVATVRGEPGQRYVLQHLTAGAERSVPGGRRVWIGSVHAGAAADSIDASGVLFAQPHGDARRARVERGSGVRLDRSGSWSRRFNLLEPASLFVEILEAGRFEVTAAGTPARFRMEPLFATEPEGYRQPDPRSAPAAWSLDPGWYRLTLLPVEAGIVEVALRGAAAADPLATGTLAERAGDDRTAAVRFGALVLAPRTRYTLRLAEQPGIVTGAIVRELPLDLEDPLPLSLAPGEEVEIPARAGGPSLLTARAEDGSPVEVAIGDGAWSLALEVPGGELRVRVRSKRESTLFATVGLTPRASDERLPPGAFDPAPPLAAGAPRALDLDRGARASFSVVASEPGLYSLETTGLLATEATLRTPVQPTLARAAQNGTGRNAALSALLRPGTYRLTLRALGDSAGHLGLRLAPASVQEGGELAVGVAARASLGAAEALRYRVRLPEAGRYRIRALGLGAPFALRVEDGDGWPVAAPAADGELLLELAAGEYTVLLLPRELAARALARIDRVRADEPRTGHGPHPLAFDSWTAHVWTEPVPGAERVPDRFRFALPAPTRVALAVTDEMAGDLVRLDGERAEERVATVAALRPLEVDLAAGEYELALACSRKNHLAPYRVRVAPADLVDGLSREVTAPAALGVATSGGREVVLESFGDADVRARLYDEAGMLLAASDDRPDDWNFRIAANLPAGRYLMRLDPVGAASATARVEMRERGQLELAPAAAGGARDLELGEAIVAIPLELPAEADLVAVGARCARPVALRLERRVAGAWVEVGASEGRSLVVAAPRESDEPWRVLLSTLDGRPATAVWTSWSGRAPRASEAELARGRRLEPLPDLEPPFGVLAVGLDRPGCFRADAGTASWVTSRGGGRPFAEEEATLVSAGSTLWLGGRGIDRLAVRRLALGPEVQMLRLNGGEAAICDLAPVAGELVAVEASAVGGEPGVRVLAASGGAPERRDRAAAFVAGRALALGGSGEGEAPLAVEIWNGGAQSAEVRVAVSAVATVGTRVARPGGEDVRLLPRAAERVRLPEGARAKVGLATGGVARFGSIRAEAPMLWAAAAPAVAIASAVGELWLVNPTAAPVASRLEVLPGGGSAETLDGQGRFAHRALDSGSLVLDLPPGSEGVRLRVGGARATLVGADGSVDRGESLAMPRSGGTLWLEHAPGLVLAWLEGAPGRAWPPLGAAERVEVPARWALAGTAARFRFELGRAALLRLQAPGAAELVLRSSTDAEARELAAGPLRFELPLPEGPADVTIAALPGEPLPPYLDATLEPLRELSEGLGAEVLLAPGESRGYTFELAAEGPVGVGARSSSGEVEAQLFGAAGERLGRGVVLWRRLPAGRYVVALTAPAAGRPVRVQPALVGIAPPPAGPPAEVMRSFVELERGAPAPPVGATAGIEAPRRLGTGAEASEAESEPVGERNWRPEVWEEEQEEEE